MYVCIIEKSVMVVQEVQNISNDDDYANYNGEYNGPPELGDIY